MTNAMDDIGCRVLQRRSNAALELALYRSSFGLVHYQTHHTHCANAGMPFQSLAGATPLSLDPRIQSEAVLRLA